MTWEYRGYKAIQGVARGYRGLQEVRGGYRGVTMGDKG